jgi:hypothetical protein
VIVPNTTEQIDPSSECYLFSSTIRPIHVQVSIVQWSLIPNDPRTSVIIFGQSNYLLEKPSLCVTIKTQPMCNILVIRVNHGIETPPAFN